MFLCTTYQFKANLVLLKAVGLNANAINMDRAMDAVTRPSPYGEAGSTTYIAGNVINTVSRSRYAQRKAQNSTRDVPPARNLAMPQSKSLLVRTIFDDHIGHYSGFHSETRVRGEYCGS